MSAAEAIADRAQQALGSPVADLRPVSCGDLNDAYALTLDDGRRLFLKTSAQALPGSFAAEAAGLRWIATAPGGPRTPQVEAVIDPAGEAGPRAVTERWIWRC